MGVRPKSVIHVGAHLGQDQGEYEKLGIERIFWCEADSECAEIIRQKNPNSHVIEGLFWSEPNKTIDFWIMQDRAQNSVFDPQSNATPLKKIKRTTTTLDVEFERLKIPSPILLVLDVQGSEIQVLSGAHHLLRLSKYVICEITEKSTMSQFSVNKADVESILKRFGYRSSIRRWSHTREYFDILFMKASLLELWRVRTLDSIYSVINPVIRFLRNLKS